MPATRPITAVERICLAILFAWLAWLPLPFGSNVPAARLPLIAVPFLVCAIAAVARLYATRDRTNTAKPTRIWVIWASGGTLLLLLCGLQLLPLSPGLLRALSPESEAIWSAASRIANHAGVAVSASRPISVDPFATTLEFFRMAALLATFTAAALLVRTHARRIALVNVLCVAAIFEAMYGLREAALQRYEIWGWTNRLIFNRVTGTFVNPNHFAHYVAIILPLALFLGAFAWHISGDKDTPLSRRLAQLLERRVVRTGFALISAVACVMGVLLAQSRGALLALSAGLLFIAALLPGKRLSRILLAATGGIVLIATLILFLGSERTVGRFMPSSLERQTLVGRRIGISAAFSLWQRFAVFGSGMGTFERVVSMEQKQDLEKLYHHAHNDYAEIAATGGTLGFMIAIVALLGGYVSLVRMTFGEASNDLNWRRRAFQTAALASLTIAMIHALFDFNFFIPSNPATLAAILGAAVASVDHDKRARR
ncbi:MAG TPA: O-antigen ligase family protein [Thermoanaerobaculia bacterium]|jgi:O-antigen ligase|nr:O-antigen ligase family protein [Thermoanaerobaculia bacterium]